MPPGNKVTLVLDANTKDFVVQMEVAKKVAKDMSNAVTDAERATKGLSKGFRNAANAAALVEGPLGGVAGRLSSMATAVGKLNPLMVGFGLSAAAVVTSLRAGLQVIGQTQTEYARLASQVIATGNAARLSAAEIDDFSRELARATLASTEELRTASGVLLSYRAVAGDTFKEVIELALDMSTVLGTNVVSATQQLGKSLQDPRQGLSQLNELGVRFTQTQKDLVAEMLRVGDGAGAQQVLLGAIRDRYEGAAKSATGLQAAYDSLGQAVAEFNETFVKTLGLDKLVTAFVNTLANAINGARVTLFGPSTLTDFQTSLDELRREEAEKSGQLERETQARRRQSLQAQLSRIRQEIRETESAMKALRDPGVDKPVEGPQIILPAISEEDFIDLERRNRARVEALQKQRNELQGFYTTAERLEFERLVRQAADQLAADRAAIGAAENKYQKLNALNQTYYAEIEELQAVHEIKMKEAAKREKEELKKNFEELIAASDDYYKAREDNRSAALDAAAAGQEFLSSLAKEGSREALVLLALEKSIAIARAVLALHTAVSQANTNPNIITRAAAITQAFAVGTAAISAIKSVQLAGARALGGPVEAGKSYMVGERGPEVVTFGAPGMITPNEKLAPNINVNVIEDRSRAGQVVQDNSEINVYVSAVMSRIAGDISRGRGMATVFESQYGLRRRGS